VYEKYTLHDIIPNKIKYFIIKISTNNQ